MSSNINILNQLIANIKSAYVARNKFATIKNNKAIYKYLCFLQNKGYISHYILSRSERQIYIYLKYVDKYPLMAKISSLMKTGTKNSISYKQTLLLKKRFPSAFVSTEKGIEFLEDVFKRKQGSTLLFEIKV